MMLAPGVDRVDALLAVARRLMAESGEECMMVGPAEGGRGAGGREEQAKRREKFADRQRARNVTYTRRNQV